jgi:type I restriction enzyme R subunit
MSYNPDSEERLETEVMKTFHELGYETVNAFNEIFGATGTLGRDNRGELVLTRYLRGALQRLNPNLPAIAYTNAIDIITQNRSLHATLESANEEVYHLLRDGVTVPFPDPKTGSETKQTLRIIGWNPEDMGANHFLAVQQLWGESELYTRRPDIILFVNGIPLVIIELKAVHRHLRDAYDENIRDYKDTLSELMWYNAFIILSNGAEARVGSISSRWEHFKEWKRINNEGEQGRADVETAILGTCNPSHLLDLVENFTTFSTLQGSTSKIVARNHQFLGVNNAMGAVDNRDTREGRLGVFWHTQGSGKSYSMVFLAQKVFRKVRGNWTFVIVTDRVELDTQIYKTFAGCGAITKPEEEVRADDGDHLKQLLRDNDMRYIFTLIHKFHARDGSAYPVLSERDNIIVITDEAHRSQYGSLASNMRQALPNASFIAFTGTPLIKGEAEQTREIFGDYISKYDFKKSIEDGATVPLYYENRIPEVELINDDLDVDIYQKLDDAQLDAEAERELERQFSHQYEILTRDDRLERIAEDIVDHYMQRGFTQNGTPSKAMVVCIDRFTAVRMYDKVMRHWKNAMATLRREQSGVSDIKREEIQRQIEFMRQTEMAVVISSSQNEVDDFRRRGLDISTHRQQMKKYDLDTRFKEEDDPFRVVFVCAMWMTGFDVPSCATIYLDKPMRNHTLMQTIARANRVFREKTNGLIVDYIGIFRNLEQALSIYGSAGDTGIHPDEKPVESRAGQVAQLAVLIEEAIDFCSSIGIDIDAILNARDYYERINLLKDVGEIIWQDDDTHDHFMRYVEAIIKGIDAIKPHREASQFIPYQQVFATIARIVNNVIRLSQETIEQVAKDISTVLDDSVMTVNWAIRNAPSQELFDLSKIDFDKLKQRFEEGRKHTSIERLRLATNRSLRQMIERNQTRISYLETFNAMIEDYNAGSMGVDEVFNRLLTLVDAIHEEEHRYVKEGLTEEELAVFDLLVRPKKTLSDRERVAIKDTVKKLLHTLKAEKLKLDWRKRDIDKASVREAIEDILEPAWSDMGLDDAAYPSKIADVYTHISTVYADGQNHVYRLAS